MADVLDFEVRIKTAEEDINKLNAQLRAIANNAENAGGRMDDVFSKVGKTIGTVFATAQLVDFAKQVVNVRKEIEAYEISFRTLLGSQDKADALFGSLREFAVKTPMQLGDLAKGAQTLLGFGIEADKIMPTLKQIGDISMGNAEKFGSLTLAFAQMSSTGKLMGQDLLQMINAGFNPLSVISQKTGKSIGELKKEMEQGAISADMIADAFKTATSEGGMFYGMLEKQSEGLAGAIAKLQGAWEEALNNIGERSQDIVVTGIKGVTTLVENYDKLISVILGVASAYGAYKTVLMASVAIDQAKSVAKTIGNFNRMRKELGLLTMAQKAFNTEVKKNPYVLLASAIIGVGAALFAYANRTSEATKKQEEFNKALGERTSGTIGKIEKMSQEWKQMGDDFKAKEQYIQDNKTALEELGIAVNSVADAEQALIDNKDKYIEAYIAKTKAILYQEEANKLIAEQIENNRKIEELDPYVSKQKSQQVGRGQYKTYTVKVKNPEITKLEEKNADLQQRINDLLSKASGEEAKAKETLTKVTDDSEIANQQNINEEIKKYRDLIKGVKKEIADLRSGKKESTNLLGDIEAEEKKLDDYQKKLDTLTGKKPGGSKPQATTYAEEANEEAQRLEESNYLNKLRYEAELKKVRAQNLEEYYDAEQDKIDKEYQYKIETIEKERQEALKNAKGEDKKEINTAFDRRIEAEEEDWSQRTAQNTQAQDAAIYKERLTKYQEFVEEYLRIERDKEERAAEIRKLQADGKITEEDATQRLETSENVALAEKTTLQAELGLTAEEVSATIGDVVASTVNMALDQIRNQLPALQAELKALKAAGADPTVIANITGKIQVMKGALKDAANETNKVSDKSGDTAKESKTDWNVVAQSLDVVNDALGEVMDTFGDMMSEGGKTAMEVVQTTLQATTSVIQAITSVSTTSFAAMSAAEKATVILAIISAAVQVITAITNAIMKNFSAQAKWRKSMEEYEAKIGDIEDAQKKFEHSLNKLSGVDYWESKSRNLGFYQEKLTQLNAQLAETNAYLEKTKEGTKKNEEGAEKAQEINDAILDTQKELYEQQQEIFEEMATTNVTSFGESMADALVEAFSQGLVGMNGAWEDTINEMIKSMLTQRMALQLTDQFEHAFSELENATKKDSIGGSLITDGEMQDFLSYMESAKSGAMAMGEEYQKLFAEMGLLDDTIDAESKGFETMSQDTADELNGRFTALQISGANIELQLGEQIELDKQVLNLSQSINDNITLATQIATDQLQELRQISQNTALLVDTNNFLKSIKDHTSRL